MSQGNKPVAETEERRPARLTRPARLALVLLGTIACLIALPLGAYLILAVGMAHAHHSSHWMAAQTVGEVSAVLLPLLLLSFGVVALVCTNQTRLKLLVVIGVVLVLDGFAFKTADDTVRNHPHPHPVSAER